MGERNVLLYLIFLYIDIERALAKVLPKEQITDETTTIYIIINN